MATQWTPTSAGSAGSTPEPGLEEQAALAGGPGRAAEVAVVSLVEAGAVRISRDGLVSAVGRPGHGATPLQGHVLRSLPRSLGDLIGATAWSAEARSLRQALVDQGLATPLRRRQVLRWARWLPLAAAMAVVIATDVLDLSWGPAAGVVVAAVVATIALGRLGRPLTARGRRVVQRLDRVAVSPNRIALVARYGLLGKPAGRHHVWEVLGIAPGAAATLRRRSRGSSDSGGASCGGGCGSCARSSCGGSSSSSDSGGSSCGGGGCGGGGD